MKISYLFVVCWALTSSGLLFAQREEGKKKEGEGAAPRSEREGERPPMPRREGDGPRTGPREGDSGPRPPMREGDSGPRPGPRDGELGPRPPMREGEGRPFPPREGDARRPEGPPVRRGEAPGFVPHDDPEMAELVRKDQDLERQSLELSNRLRSAPKSERDKLKADLVDVVKKHFDCRQERRELQVKRMEEEIKRLKEQVEARTNARDELIGRRVLDLTGEPYDAGF